nr:beta-galactosidase trimerization domain-containing protein [Planctomycetota bacterium]
PDAVRSLWNQWLKGRYETAERLRAVWGENAAGSELGELDFPPSNSGRWEDVPAIDRLRFQTWLLRHWNEAHVAAVRGADSDHPITSEYYSMPFAGIDLPMTIDGQDVSNIGFFDLPVADLDNLPLKIRFNDLRARGKGVSLGEYGVKTHPAWTTENGAQGYHLARTEEQQKQLFVAVAHYALGLGASKVQNWCLRDAQARVFPWGIFYPNQLVPKDVAYVHRNLSLVWRHFRPKYVPPPVTVCLANQLRLGNDEGLGPAVAYRTIADLLALHYDFNCIDDHHLSELPTETEVLIYPSPFALRDDTYDRLKTWVASGGTLLITGDCTYDADRQRTRTSRLEELSGVRFAAENYSNVARDSATDIRVDSSLKQLDGLAVRPCMRVHPGRAEVLAAAEDGTPVLLRGQLGKGTVYFFTDPIELADGDEAATVRRNLYSTVLAAARQKPLPVEPNQPWLHAMAQRTAEGSVHVVFNTKLEEGTEPIRLPTAAGTVQLTTRNRWPALVATTCDGNLVATIAYGGASIDGTSVMAGSGLKAALSLDGKDLRKSVAVLAAPFEPGSVRLPKRPGSFVASIGEFRGGRWTELERISLAAGELALEIDADRATCLILVCESHAAERWTEYLSQAMCRPVRIPGY